LEGLIEEKKSSADKKQPTSMMIDTRGKSKNDQTDLMNKTMTELR